MARERFIQAADGAEGLHETQAQLSHLLEYSPAVIYALKVEGQNVVPYTLSGRSTSTCC